MKSLDTKKYELAPEENDYIFQEVILPYFATGVRPSQEPVLLFLTGQPGAGKSSLATKCTQNLPEGAISFGADDLRALHPSKDEILRTDEFNYPLLTKKDSGIWREKLIKHALNHRYNILIESILSNENDWNLDTFRWAKEKGYKTHCLVLGTHEFQSYLGMYARQENQKRLTGFGHPVYLDLHDRTYSLLPHIAYNMLVHNTVDRVSVHTRSLDLFFDSHNPESKPEDIYASITSARQNSLNPSELNSINQGWETVHQYMQERNASPTEIATATHLHRRFKKESGLPFIFPGISKNERV